MLNLETGQSDIYSELLESLIPAEHVYRKLLALINFSSLLEPLHELYASTGTKGIPLESGFKCLLIQFMENLSDREAERYIRENLVARWFCDFPLSNSRTPDHAYFGRLRQRIGLEKLTELFNAVVEQLRQQNVVSGTFTFIDTTAVVSKVALWKERDQAIEEGLEKLNNSNVSEFAADKDARFGAKNANKFWFGYKNGLAEDCKEGIIVALTSDAANATDQELFKKVMPPTGAAIGDKGFDAEEIRKLCEEAGVHPMIIKKNNRKDKNKDLDRYISKLRAPFEGVFTLFRGKKNWGGYVRTFFRGQPKVQFELTFKALAINFKRLVKIMDLPHYAGLRIG